LAARLLLLPDGCVAKQLKMLAYYHIRSAFDLFYALLSNKIESLAANSEISFDLLETGLDWK
jgi:hypothetical protein